MSHAHAIVFFPDSKEYRFAEYNGTCDTVAGTALRESPHEVSVNWRVPRWTWCECGQDERALYWSTYGGGELYAVPACRHCNNMKEALPDYPVVDGGDAPPSWPVNPAFPSFRRPPFVDLLKQYDGHPPLTALESL